MKKLILLIFVVAASLNAQRVQGQIGQVPVVAAADNSPVGGAGNLTTVGSVPYVSASGILNQDAGQFVWDATNNRLGIGTATPDRSLEVKSAIYGGIAVTTATVSDIISFTLKSTAAGGQDWRLEQGRTGAGILNFYNGSTGSTPLTILANGNVGIGTTTPGSAFDVSSAPLTTFTNNPITTTLISTTAYAANMGAGIQFQGKWNSAGQSTTFAYIGGVKENSTDGNYDGKLVFGTRQNGLGANDMTRMTILASGNVGIGTSPGYKLEVAGSSNTEIARVGDGTRSFGISTYTPNSGGVTLKNSGTGLISLTTANAVLIGTSYAGLGSGISANTVAIEGNVGIGTTTPGYALDVAKSAASGLTASFYDQTASGVTGVRIYIGSGQTGASTVLSVNGVVAFAGDNNGGTGSALLGSNSPASSLLAPYTWIKIRTADNSIAYIPVWK